MRRARTEAWSGRWRKRSSKFADSSLLGALFPAFPAGFGRKHRDVRILENQADLEMFQMYQWEEPWFKVSVTCRTATETGHASVNVGEETRRVAVARVA